MSCSWKSALISKVAFWVAWRLPPKSPPGPPLWGASQECRSSHSCGAPAGVCWAWGRGSKLSEGSQRGRWAAVHIKTGYASLQREKPVISKLKEPEQGAVLFISIRMKAENTASNNALTENIMCAILLVPPKCHIFLKQSRFCFIYFL